VAAVLWHRIAINNETEQHFCADTGYTGRDNIELARQRKYIPLIKQRGRVSNENDNEIIASKHWIVEVSHSWFNRFRKLVIRYEKKSMNYLALCMLAAAIIALNKIGVIYG